MFISFEGIDGCGKTTQLELLQARLSREEYRICRTREPGGTSLAETIRNYLLHSKDSLEARAELLLFGAARAQHVAEVVRPALAKGEIVLSDRFADSSLAYQGGGLGLDGTFIREMNAFATNNLQPDISFFLDVDPLVGQARREGEKADRIEARGMEFQDRVRQAFLAIADEEPQRFIVLNADQAREALHEAIVAVLRERGLNLK